MDKPQETQNCANCAFSVVFENNQRPIFGQHRMRICRRLPPVFMPNDKRKMEDRWPAQPPVTDITWCGEWSFALPTPLPQIETPPVAEAVVTEPQPKTIAGIVKERRASGALFGRAAPRPSAEAVHDIAAQTLGDMAQPVTPQVNEKPLHRGRIQVIDQGDKTGVVVDLMDGFEDDHYVFTSSAALRFDQLKLGHEVLFEPDPDGRPRTDRVLPMPVDTPTTPGH